MTTLTGSAVDVDTALASTGITNLGNEAVTLNDTTVAASLLNSIDGNTTGPISFADPNAIITTSAAKDTLDVVTGFAAANYTVKYSAASEAGVVLYTDDGDSTFGDDDTFAETLNLDVFQFDDGDIVDISGFNLLTLDTNYSGTIQDGRYFMAQGDWDGTTSVFTVDNANGNDMILIWDGDTASGSVAEVATVITGVTSLDVGTELLI